MKTPILFPFALLLTNLCAVAQNESINSSDLVNQLSVENTTGGSELSIDSASASMESAMDLMKTQVWVDPFPQRPFYNHTFRLGSGYSINTLRMDQSMRAFNDTSEHHFDVMGHTPVFSFSHYMAIDSTFSLGYSMGYAQSEIYYDNQYYGDKFMFVALNPMLHIMRTYNFEYYVKFNIGLSYQHNKLKDVHSEILQRVYPTGFHMFTGFTFAGINYLVNDHLALNAELSIWSSQTINCGITYRFMKEKQPEFDMQFAY